MSTDAASISSPALRESAQSAPRDYLSTSPAERGQRRLALAAVTVSAVVFLVAAPFAKVPLTPLPAFIPIYESALVICDLITAVLLFGQYSILRSRALLALACGYLYTALTTIAHALSFPGLFAPTGLLGAGPQTTAWLYQFWHGGFPLLVIAYALLKAQDRRADRVQARSAVAAPACVAAVVAAVCAFTLLATAGHDLLPPIMSGDGYTPALIFVISSVWALSLLALAVLWRQPAHSMLDLWLMVVMCAWLFDIALSGVLNAGRYDVGWYAGRIYGLLAASFVLMVLLLENSLLHAKVDAARESEGQRAQAALDRHEERLRILHEIDRAIVAELPLHQIAGAVIQPLRALLGVPRAIVNLFDLESDQAEWLAAAGRHRTHVGPGVRYSLRLMGDVEALKRGETQVVDTRALPPGPETGALLASGVEVYMVVPMITGSSLIGAISFGGAEESFPVEQVRIAQEVATQLAIAISQSRLLERVRRHSEELESLVRDRTAELQAANKELEAFSYSISHDLRAPLRGIIGFADALMQDHGADLSEEARRKIAIVRDEGRRLGVLIDELLAFSRLGRKPLQKAVIDMEKLARASLDGLHLGQDQAGAAVEFGALPEAQGDRVLLGQVWANLLSNAVKFSAKHEQPRIVVGTAAEEKEHVYFVRDNGAGFDPKYQSKLFGVFQRLHAAADFPGTGVGLALVQRIVNRHGGRVWAESRPGEGATFYFTLPKEQVSGAV